MIGYIFETTNTKTGETYVGKRYAVTFDKTYLGDDDNLAVAIEKYGRPSFEVKMLMPFESQEKLDAAFAEMAKPSKKAKVVEESVEEPVEEKPARTRKKKVAEEE